MWATKLENNKQAWKGTGAYIGRKVYHGPCVLYYLSVITVLIDSLELQPTIPYYIRPYQAAYSLKQFPLPEYI